MEFFKREQLPIPEDAKKLLEQINRDFPDFISDKCSNSPDSLFGFDFSWACTIHDYKYCSRCHSPGALTYNAKIKADKELEQHIDDALPFRWSWVKYVYYVAVWRYGGMGAFNSCGPEVGYKCRHNIVAPDWQLKMTKNLGKVTETE